MGFQYGSVVYPIQVPATPGNWLLPTCDPALAKVVDFLSYMIRTYASNAIVGSAGLLSTDQNQAIDRAVMQAAAIDPDTIARHEQWQFPLLCGWRKTSLYSERTTNWVQDITKVGIAYIISPLSGTQLMQVGPVLTSVSQICNYALNAGHDPGYRSDERIAEANNIARVRLVSGNFGAYDFGGSAKPPYFPAWVGEIELTEQAVPYTVGLTDLTGTDFIATQQAQDDLVTAIAADAAISDTTFQVDSSDGFVVGDVVLIGFGTPRAESASLTAVPNATHLTIASPGLQFAHTAAQVDSVMRAPVTIVTAKSEVG